MIADEFWFFAKKSWQIPNFGRHKRIGMADAKDRAAEILRGPEGGGIYLSLLDFAQKLARRYGWKLGGSLPQSRSPDEVVKDVVIKVLEGNRVWDETKEPSLVNALKGMVRSDLGHLFTGYEATHLEPIAKSLPDGSERAADDFPTSEANPEQILLQREQSGLEIVALDMILEEVQGNADLERVFLELYESDSLQEVARRSELPMDRVYSVRRELERIATRITPQRVAREARNRRKP